MRYIKKHVFIDKLYTKSVLIAEKYNIEIDDTLYDFLRSRLSRFRIIDLLDDKKDNDIRIRFLLLDYVRYVNKKRFNFRDVNHF